MKQIHNGITLMYCLSLKSAEKKITSFCNYYYVHRTHNHARVNNTVIILSSYAGDTLMSRIL